jgi:hypothetical protein
MAQSPDPPKERITEVAKLNGIVAAPGLKAAFARLLRPVPKVSPKERRSRKWPTCRSDGDRLFWADAFRNLRSGYVVQWSAGCTANGYASSVFCWKGRAITD